MTMTLVFISLSLALAQVGKTPSDSMKACMKKTKDIKHCECWARNIDPLPQNLRQLSNDWVSHKFDITEFERRDRPLAEYAFKINEFCAKDPLWKAEPLELEPK